MTKRNDQRKSEKKSLISSYTSTSWFIIEGRCQQNLRAGIWRQELDAETRSEFSLLGFLIIACWVFLSSSTKDLQPRGSTGHISGLSNINRQSRKYTTGFSLHQYCRGFCQLRFCLYKWVDLVSNWHKSRQHIIFLLLYLPFFWQNDYCGYRKMATLIFHEFWIIRNATTNLCMRFSSFLKTSK